MSAWKLVEAVEEPKPVDPNVAAGFVDRRGGRGGGRGRGMGGRGKSSFGARNGPSRGGGYHDRGARSEEIQYEIDPQMREYYAHMAIQQIELLYGTDYLCVDTYFRSYMDEEGYVPMALLSSYPNVACYAATIEDLVSKLSVKEDSILEVDVSNETVRLKTGWDKWLMPNAAGGKGVPKYVKQVEGSVDSGNGTYFNGDWCEDGSNEVDNINGTEIDHKEDRSESIASIGNGNIVKDTVNLSASAMEFKPKSSNIVPIVVPIIPSTGKVSYAAAASKLSTATA